MDRFGVGSMTTGECHWLSVRAAQRSHRPDHAAGSSCRRAPPRALDLPMTNPAVGEPQGAMPAFARQIVTEEIDGWNKYPPNQGIPDLNLAIVEWLSRRYRLPAGLLDAAQHVIPTAGSKEGVYIIATVATPQQKAGGKPIVALPNPFYTAYLGGGC